MFKEELDYFIDNQEGLVKQYRGKVLVIKGHEVVGAYDTALEAYLAALKRHAPGTFMIQPCEPGPQAYTVMMSPHAIVSQS
jgi:hypothetical protein